MAYENLVSVLGLITLLGIAWLLSYHRTKIKLRTVLWGLGLQFLFALIILREDAWSHVGMVVFGALLVTYILVRPAPPDETGEVPDTTDPPSGEESREDDRASERPDLGRLPWERVALGLAAAVVVGFLVPRYLALVVTPLLLLAVLFLFVNGRWKLLPAAQRWVGVLFLALGTGALITSGTTGQAIFQELSAKVAYFLSLSDYGARFLFGNLVEDRYFFPGPDAGWPGFAFQFAFKVLPTIIFFGGFMAVLYYLGIMQKVIVALARFMRWTLGTSGAETLSCSANIFVGQTEAPLLIKPFLDGMTRSELLTVMVGGFATIAGGVLAGYIAMGVPAGHLIAASVMSAPAALVLGKILFPETEHSETAGDAKLPEIEAGGNVIEAATNGITDGFKLALNVGAMLVGFIALIAVIDVGLGWADGWVDGTWLGGPYVEYAAGGGGMSPAVGEYEGWFPGSLQTLFGTLLAPLAWLMGVPWADAAQVGNLLGVKLSLNEFVAFGSLAQSIQAGALSERGIVIATYALTGFANFSSIGIQIGGISAIAPHRKADLAKVGLKAMFGGALASWTTATIAGMLL